MSNSLCLTPLISCSSANKPGILIGKFNAPNTVWMNDDAHNNRNVSLKVKATNSNPGTQTNSNPGTKTNSILCSNCDGNGAIVCKQCEGSGVNSVDHFNGRFKAGGLCWLCRGKKEVLCGDCNGAGFLGGFMSTFDE